MFSEFSCCALCPRECRADRVSGQTGFCRAAAGLKTARAALHFWEEPCISGPRGSGTVFFSHCTLGCVFCQNGEISRGGFGLEITPERLCEIFFELAEQGAHNINLVTPTHYLPPVVEAIAAAKKRGLAIPFVYNCGGYEKPSVIAALSEYIDIWLPDFKYFSPSQAARYSAAPNYPETAIAAISEMVRRAGPPVFGGDGMLQSGVLVRHLLLPGGLADSLKAVGLLHRLFGGDIILSLMSQYTPPADPDGDFEAAYPLLCRRVNPRHYRALTGFAAELGFSLCYIQQEISADAGFIPLFDGQGVLPALKKRPI